MPSCYGVLLLAVLLCRCSRTFDLFFTIKLSSKSTRNYLLYYSTPRESSSTKRQETKTTIIALFATQAEKLINKQERKKRKKEREKERKKKESESERESERVRVILVQLKVGDFFELNSSTPSPHHDIKDHTIPREGFFNVVVVQEFH
ncbi:hypothetical protein EYC80_002608 [Monilinia laxa]|uniref:Uncharacterized protein n=1 Tax=Monilinia laxa TaxID=61186 RepID=A0A5N6K4L6_MONLA|nr:hypothetical protein EYC80_002608 [Monilinia laxa]